MIKRTNWNQCEYVLSWDGTAAEWVPLFRSAAALPGLAHTRPKCAPFGFSNETTPHGAHEGMSVRNKIRLSACSLVRCGPNGCRSRSNRREANFTADLRSISIFSFLFFFVLQFSIPPISPTNRSFFLPCNEQPPTSRQLIFFASAIRSPSKRLG